MALPPAEPVCGVDGGGRPRPRPSPPSAARPRSSVGISPPSRAATQARDRRVEPRAGGAHAAPRPGPPLPGSSARSASLREPSVGACPRPAPRSRRAPPAPSRARPRRSPPRAGRTAGSVQRAGLPRRSLISDAARPRTPEPSAAMSWLPVAAQPRDGPRVDHLDVRGGHERETDVGPAAGEPARLVAVEHDAAAHHPVAAVDVRAKRQRPDTSKLPWPPRRARPLGAKTPPTTAPGRRRPPRRPRARGRRRASPRSRTPPRTIRPRRRPRRAPRRRRRGRRAAPRRRRGRPGRTAEQARVGERPRVGGESRSRSASVAPARGDRRELARGFGRGRRHSRIIPSRPS